MIDKHYLPMNAPAMVLDRACNTGISVLLNLHREIDEHKLTTTCEVQNMVQDMISELEEIKETGE